MTEHNPHPAITFKITGYRSNDEHSERRQFETDHHIFPDGSFEDVKQRFPVGSVHTHVPPAPCRYDLVFAGDRDMAQERAQLGCRLCYPQVAPPVDNRRTS